MTVKLLTEHHFGFIGLNGGCTGLSQSTLVKMSLCLKSHAMAHMFSEYLTEPNQCHQRCNGDGKTPLHGRNFLLNISS